MHFENEFMCEVSIFGASFRDASQCTLPSSSWPSVAGSAYSMLGAEAVVTQIGLHHYSVGLSFVHRQSMQIARNVTKTM